MNQNTVSLQDFFKTNGDFSVIKSELSQSPYNLTFKETEDLFLVKYSQHDSDFSYKIVQESRGSIFCKKTFKYICRPFDKFFNYTEPNCKDISFETARVQEKLDGCFIKIYWFNGWKIASNGAINAFEVFNPTQDKSFGNMVMQVIEKYYNNFTKFVLTLDKDFTYMFELVSPDNRIVLHYPETDLYYLGKRHNMTGEEFFPECDKFEFKTPLVYTGFKSLEDLFEKVKIRTTLTSNIMLKEGFVVCDSDFNRAKFKYLDYIALHHLKNKMSEIHLIDLIKNNEISEVLVYFPDASSNIDSLVERIKKMCNEIHTKLTCYKSKTETTAFPIVAKEISNDPYKTFIFKYIKQDLTHEQIYKEFLQFYKSNTIKQLLKSNQ